MKRLSTVVLLLSILAGPAIGHAATPEKALQSRIDRYMAAAEKVDHFMGAILVARDGHVIIAKGYGMANVGKKIPNKPDTEFKIGSITKQFTAMAILMLEADGKLNVHDPVCKYVTHCPKDWKPITISNLLTHTSGITDYTDFPNFAESIMAKQWTPTRLMALFKGKPLEFKPGTKFSYSNSGYVVLGYIVAKVSGESYAQFVEQRIFARLGMRHSGYDSNHRTGNGRALGYVYAGNKQYIRVLSMTPGAAFSAGALYSTVRDLYTWDRALAANKLLPNPLHEQMFAPHVEVGPDHLTHVMDMPGKIFYGYGWFVSSEFGHRRYSHEGGMRGFTTLNSWFPGRDACIIVLDNMTSSEIFEITQGLTKILFGKPYTLPKFPAVVQLPASALRKFVGTYQLAPNFELVITRKGDRLIAQATGQPAFPLYPESTTEFFLKVTQASVTFNVDEKGEASGLVLHQNGVDHPAKKVK